MNISNDRVSSRVTCHGENTQHPVNAAVSQQGHLHSSGSALLLSPFGLERSPDAGAKDQQVEKQHRYHSWNVDRHGGLGDLLP